MPSRFPVVRQFAYCALVFLTAACGGSSSKAPTTPELQAAQDIAATPTEVPPPVNTRKACELLTKNEAEKALGSPVEKVTDESAPTVVGDSMLRGYCYYRAVDGSSVSLTLNTYMQQAAAVTQFETLKRRVSEDASLRTFRDLGDGGFTAREGLVARRGPMHLLIALRLKGTNAPKDYGDLPALKAVSNTQHQLAVEAFKRLPPD